MFLKTSQKTSQNSQKNTCVGVPFKIKFQVLSCEFCDIFKNTFFIEHRWATASVTRSFIFFIELWFVIMVIKLNILLNLRCFGNIWAAGGLLSKIDVLKNLTNFTGKHLYWSHFLIKMKTWKPTTLLKRGSITGVFLRTLIVKNIWERLLL